jgi:phospholipid/cholesterol/gamma-HCH transport system substrate-binding protein
MNSSGIGVGRIAAMVIFALSCFGLLLFLWVTFGGPIPLKPQGYRFQTSFKEATQLAVEADVRISGVPVGKVKSIEPDKDTGRTTAIIEMDSTYAPVKADARAMLRQKTLLGETYVELSPGSEGAPDVPEDGALKDAQISETVELDEIYRAFDAKTRDAFRTWMEEQAIAVDGRGVDINNALGNLGPFAEDAAEIVDVLNRQEGGVQALIRDTGVVFEALTERNGQLRELIENSNLVFATTAERDQELADTFRILPTFQRESRTTLTRLTEFAEDTNPLVNQLRPAARELSPTLDDLAALSPDLKELFRRLDPLITASRRGFPAAQQLLDDLKPLTGQLDPTLRQLIPMLDFLGLYKRELTAFFANTVAATQAYEVRGDTKVHYLRTTNPLNAENLAVYPRRIGSNRPNPYMLPGAMEKLPTGLEVQEDRHCGRGVPVISQVAEGLLGELGIPDEVVDQISGALFPVTSGGQTPAPPCKPQAPLNFQGEALEYPHVKAQPAP